MVRSVVVFMLVGAVAVAVGCGNSNGKGSEDSGVEADAMYIAPPTSCAVSGGPICDPTIEICFNDKCTPNACLTDSNMCADGDQCEMDCVAVTDPCETIDCGSEETCYEGTCLAGCFPPSPCLGVTCDTEQYCDRGQCLDLNPCDGECGAGYACNVVCKQLSPCQDVECADNEFCVAGTCRDNPCFGVECVEGAFCDNGTCIDTCEGCACETYEACVFGNCVCVGDCTGKSCGDDDGCGNKCDVCPNADEVCNVNNGMCSCDPSCSGLTCGEINACGDPCDTNSGCNGASCEPDPANLACVCSGTTCEEGRCCNNSATVCYDGTDGDTLTDNCCLPEKLCGEGTDQRCCGNSQTCLDPDTLGGDDQYCCSNNDMCTDLPGQCCGSGSRAFCDTAGITGDPVDDFCCANATRACQENNAGGAPECCGSGQRCFDGPDVEDTLEDTCCSNAGWCGDSKTCCNFAAGEQCYDGNDQNPDNDTCCAPSCDGKGCGDDDGCGGYCEVDNCLPGQSCFVQDIDNVYCRDDVCNPGCTPCEEVCIAGTCNSKKDECPDDFNYTTCECDGGGID